MVIIPVQEAMTKMILSLFAIKFAGRDHAILT